MFCDPFKQQCIIVKFLMKPEKEETEVDISEKKKCMKSHGESAMKSATTNEKDIWTTLKP